MGSLWQDLRYAARLLANNPGFTALAVLSLAIGIGINSTSFSIIDYVMLRPLPVQNPNQLVNISSMRQGIYHGFSYPDYEDICRQSTSFSGVIASYRQAAKLSRNGETEVIRADLVSENYFSVLGVEMALGQTFAPKSVGNASEDPPVIISHSLWQRRFGADAEIVGKTIVLNRRNAIVHGVAPRSFSGLQKANSAEVWLPIASWAPPQDLQKREYRYFELLVARLHSGTSPERARSELNTIAKRLADSYPATNQGVTYEFEAIADEARQYSISAAIILVFPCLILLTCCANVSGMILAQAEGRRGELAVRFALGASRGRLIRQALTESSLLALTGALLGLLLTLWLINLAPGIMPPSPFLIGFDFRVDWRVLLFTLFTFLIASLVSGLAPALQVTKPEIVTILKREAGRSKIGKWWLGLRSLLVAGQIALSLALLISTGILLKSLHFSEQINPGFDSKKKLLIVNVSPTIDVKEGNQNFYLPVIERIRTLSGISRATYAFRMPLSGSGGGAAREISIPGVAPPPGQKGFIVKFNAVGRDYFQTVGTNIKRGREFNKYDELPDQRVAIVSEKMAERFWPSFDPIGRVFTMNGKDFQIVGVAQDGRINKMHEAPEPYIYFPFAQVPTGDGVIIVEAASNPIALAGAVKDEIRSVDKTAAWNIETLKDLMSFALYEDRIIALIAGALGILAALMASIGLYGVVSHLVGRRTHEIGIRMALGARREDIFRMVIGQAVVMSCLGIAIGLPVSFLIISLFADKIFGVAPTDIWSFSAGTLVVIIIALLASYVPARRATKVDPIAALRAE